MSEHRVYIGVGSNIDPESNIPRALELLAARAHVEAVSTFYQTAPLLRPGDPPFLNGVARARTWLDADVLKFEILRGIETQLGRVRGGDAYAPRPIDLDILLFDTLIIDAPGLRVPDPDLWNRPFLAVPLLELEPRLVLPDGRLLNESPCARTSVDMVCMEAFTRQVRERLGV